MRAEAAAFAPGHVTGFFEIRDEASDPAQIGSRGAGFSVSRGVHSRVRVEDAGVPGVTVTADGSIAEAATTRRAVELLVGGESLHVAVDQTVELPVSQGFGMSSAGALSATLALAEALGRPRREAVWAAHCAEVFQRTGLGDVVGADAGGLEVRVKPGVPPYGEVRPWRAPAPLGPLWLVVVSDAVLTRRVLTDPRRRADINRIGGRLVDEFATDPNPTRFVEASRRFAIEAKLATPEILALWDDLGADVLSGQCQLGGSVFVFGGTPDLGRRLERRGDVHRVDVAPTGAHVTKPGKSGS